MIFIILRMYCTYIHKTKFDSIRILVLCDIKNICKKLPFSKMSKTFILRHNNAEKLLTDWKKKLFNEFQVGN